jgi:hypothetical protein
MILLCIHLSLPYGGGKVQADGRKKLDKDEDKNEDKDEN